MVEDTILKGVDIVPELEEDTGLVEEDIVPKVEDIGLALVEVGIILEEEGIVPKVVGIVLEVGDIGLMEEDIILIKDIIQGQGVGINLEDIVPMEEEGIVLEVEGTSLKVGGISLMVVGTIREDLKQAGVVEGTHWNCFLILSMVCLFLLQSPRRSKLLHFCPYKKEECFP